MLPLWWSENGLLLVFFHRCPEYDTLESNKYTVAGTLHKCNGGDGYWSDCDRGGCQNNAFYVDSSMFCPEDRYPVFLYLNSG